MDNVDFATLQEAMRVELRELVRRVTP
jgi:hypothetical protein